MIDLSSYGHASVIQSAKDAPVAVRQDVLDGRAIYRIDIEKIPAALRVDFVMLENNLKVQPMRLNVRGTIVESLFSVSKVLASEVLLRLEGDLATR